MHAARSLPAPAVDDGTELHRVHLPHPAGAGAVTATSTSPPSAELSARQPGPECAASRPVPVPGAGRLMDGLGSSASPKSHKAAVDPKK